MTSSKVPKYVDNKTLKNKIGERMKTLEKEIGKKSGNKNL